MQRFGIDETAWLIDWSFDQLFGWHEWAMNNRQILPSGLIAPGSEPILPLVDPSDWGVNTMQGARWETGMDSNYDHLPVRVVYRPFSDIPLDDRFSDVRWS